MGQFLLTLLEAVLIQAVVLFGLFFVLGYVLSKLQGWTQENYFRSVGWKGILWTAWIGTPVHELCHLLFALLFGHRIVRVRLFAPNRETGELGEVQHSYNPGNFYQVAGNFFIGAAPTIGGAFVLGLLAYFLLPNGKELLPTLASGSASFPSFVTGIFSVLAKIFAPQNFQSTAFWIFLYISFCVSCHLAPSKVDRGQMWGGFVWLLLLLVAFNVVGLFFRYDPSTLVVSFATHVSLLTALFVYAILISACHFLLSCLLLLVFRRREPR
ncbi:MAG: hypothetical protein WA001_01795 [Patescibacteria group bacterium]